MCARCSRLIGRDVRPRRMRGGISHKRSSCDVRNVSPSPRLSFILNVVFPQTDDDVCTLYSLHPSHSQDRKEPSPLLSQHSNSSVGDTILGRVLRTVFIVHTVTHCTINKFCTLIGVRLLIHHQPYHDCQMFHDVVAQWYRCTSPS